MQPDLVLEPIQTFVPKYGPNLKDRKFIPQERFKATRRTPWYAVWSLRARPVAPQVRIARVSPSFQAIMGNRVEFGGFRPARELQVYRPSRPATDLEVILGFEKTPWVYSCMFLEIWSLLLAQPNATEHGALTTIGVNICFVHDLSQCIWRVQIIAGGFGWCLDALPIGNHQQMKKTVRIIGGLELKP